MRRDLKPMQTEPEPITTPEIPAALPAVPEKKLLAPVWHTVLIIVILLGNSYLTARFFAAHRDSAPASAAPRTLDYLFTIGFELFLLLLVWIGLRIKRYSMRELIGGKWKTPEDFLIDIGIALGFWVVSALVLLGLAYVLGQVNAAQVNDMKQRLSGLVPRSGVELA